MGYERLGPSGATGSDAAAAPNHPHIATSAPPENGRSSSNKKKRKVAVLSLVGVAAVALIVFAGLFAGLRARVRPGQPGPGLARKPSQAISQACGLTRYPDLCVDSLMEFPGSERASTPRDLVHVAVNMTLHHFSRALYSSSAISFLSMPPRVRSAYDACLELLDDSVDALSRALSSVASSAGGAASPAPAARTQDVVTWLSAALTNHDTCAEGFDGSGGGVKEQMTAALKNLSELVSNCLAIFAGSGGGDDFAGVPIQNRRRLLGGREISGGEKFPRWMGRRERELLEMPVSQIQADIIVSADGNGTCKTIAEAIKKAPERSTRRTIIYVKAGR